MQSKIAEYRAIQLTGKSTYIISLPKTWVRKTKLSKGSKVLIEELGNNALILKPINMEKESKKETVIQSGGFSELETVYREIVSAYLAGANIIKIVFNRDLLRCSDEIKTFIKEKLMGFEILEESSNFMTTQSLIRFNELPLKKVLERMWVTTYYMIKDVIKALKLNDVELAENVIKRDDEVDRFHFYSIRQIRHAIEDIETLHSIGLNKLEELLEYKSIIKSIERIADHTTRIAKMIKRLNKRLARNLVKDLEELAEKSVNMFESAMRALYKMDKSLAHNVLNSLEETQSLEEKLTRKYILEDKGDKYKPLEIIAIKLILDSLRRIAEYSSDIAEGVLNLTSI